MKKGILGGTSRRLRVVLVLGALGALLVAGTAFAVRAEVGKSVVSATAQLTPTGLPAHGAGAPVTLSMATHINTKDGSLPPPLKTLTVELDKHGSIQTAGLPTCTMAQLENTTPQQARSKCAKALVGKGTGVARVKLPGAATVKMTSPLSFFNAPPTGGRPTVIAHAYETLPKPQTLLVPIVLQKINSGRYGYRAEIQFPEIAEGYGSAILAEADIGLTYKHGGQKVGFINATCSGGRLQVTGKLDFANGDYFPATLISSCHVAG
jgi:hypothetical protein